MPRFNHPLGNSNTRAKRTLFLTAALICLFLIGNTFTIQTNQATPLQPFIDTLEINGPMVNEVIFSIYHGGDAQWAAMVDGLIDIGNAPISPEERSEVSVNEWEVDA